MDIGDIMIKILNSSLARLGVIKNVISSDRMEEINGENILDFTTVLDSTLQTYINDNTVFELDGDYFDIAYYKKDANDDDTFTIDVESEHISYRLNRPEYNKEYFTEIGTPSVILGKILQGTGFTIGTVEFPTAVTYSAQEAKSRRQLLMEFAAYIGAELKFDKFVISLVQHLGSTTVKPVIKGKNVNVVSKIVNKREKDKAGNTLVSYSCAPVYLPGDSYTLGDDVLLIQNDLGIREQLRVVKITRDPYMTKNAKFEFSNYIDGLADQLYRIETSTVMKGNLYYGARISPEEGFESIRSDKMARSVFNADKIAMQIGDGNGNWTDVLYFDPATRTYMFDGRLSATVIEALEAQFDITISNVMVTNILAAETGYIAQLTVDSVETSTKVQNYKNGDTSDVNFIRIQGMYAQWITAQKSSGTEQAVDRHGNPLYWKDNARDIVVLEDTGYPVVIYRYDEYVKMEISFEDLGGGYTPKITMGVGDGVTATSSKAEIYKGQTGLELIYYKSNTGVKQEILIDDTGIRQIGSTGAVGLRNIAVGPTAPTIPQNNDLWINTGGV